MKITRCFDVWRRCLEPAVVRRLAKSTDLFRRKPRKAGPRAVFWGLVLGFGAEGRRSLTGIGSLCAALAGKRWSRQAAHDRFAAAGGFMRAACERLLRKVAALDGAALPEGLRAFEDVEILDSTTVRLADKLARRFPACRTNVRSAALKIHARVSLGDRQVRALALTSERVHDRRGVRLPPSLKDRLLLFDLGYFDYGLLAAMEAAGGRFLTRLKESADGVILRVRRGCLRRHEGGRLNRRIYEGPVDLDVAFRGGVVLRVVGLWNREAGRHHWYLTNLDAEEWPAEEVAELYRLRWQIELLFREWKSVCRLGDLPSAHPGVVEALVYASVCASLLTRLVMILAARRFGLPPGRLCPTRAALLLGLHALKLGEAACGARIAALKRVLESMLELVAVHAWSTRVRRAQLQEALA